MKQSKSSLLILFSVIVLDLIGFGVVIPILPFFAETYGANATVLGFLLTSYAGMQFLFSPVWGKLSDRIGRKKVLLITMSGAAIGMLILGLAPSLTWLFIGRIVAGIFGANISVATAYVTDVTTEKNRAKGMGLIGAAFGIGFILGPALGGLLSPYGYSVPILTAAGLGLINIIYAYFSLGESHPSPSQKSPKIKPKVLSFPSLRKVCFINLLFTFGFNQLEATFAFFMMDRFNYDAKQVAFILVMMALIMVAIQGGMIRHLVARFGEKSLFLAGGLLLSASFFAVPFSYQITFLLIPLAIASVGRGISQPSLLSITSKYAPDDLRGATMGIYQSSASLARVIGPITAGFLYVQNPAYPYYLAALMMGLVFILSLTLPKPKEVLFSNPEIKAANADLAPS